MCFHICNSVHVNLFGRYLQRVSVAAQLELMTLFRRNWRQIRNGQRLLEWKLIIADDKLPLNSICFFFKNYNKESFTDYKYIVKHLFPTSSISSFKYVKALTYWNLSDCAMKFQRFRKSVTMDMIGPPKLPKTTISGEF